jgi:hypothetical protein
MLYILFFLINKNKFITRHCFLDYRLFHIKILGFNTFVITY